MQSNATSRTRRLAALLGVASILLLSSCSDDGGDDEGASTDTEAAEDTTAETTDEPLVANTCDEIPAPEGGAVNQTAVVDLIDFEFCQPEITIQAGEAIEFINFGATRHQVSHQPPGDQERFFRSEPLLSGESFVKTIETPGVYPFICSFHFEEMTGTITVE